MFNPFVSKVKVSKHAASKQKPDAAARKKAKRKMQAESRRRNRCR